MNSFSRGKGHSATGAAAYRAGLAIDDPTTGERHDYTRRQGVVAVDMLAPDGAPAWALDPHELWGRVEANDARKNARVAREVLIALPHELDPEARRALAREVGQWLVDRYQVAVQVAIHAPDRSGDDRNHHAHILFTPRQVGPEGLGAYSAKVYDDFKGGPAELKILRAAVADRTNQALAQAGVAARVDHRTLAAQKAEAAERGDFKTAATLDRLPTQHEGKATTQARRRGERVPRAQRNDRRQRANERRLEAHDERFQALKAEAQAAGRLTPVDEQAAHARALLERTQEGRARLCQAATPSPTPRSHTHGRNARTNRPLAAPLTSDSRYRRGHRDNGHAHGLGALPAVRPLNRASTCRRASGDSQGPGAHPAGAGGLLRPHAQGHSGAGGSLQRLRAQRGASGPVVRAPTVRSGGPGPSQGKHDDRRAELVATFQAAQSMEEAIRACLAIARHALLRSSSLTPWQRSTARGVLTTHEAEALAHLAHRDAAAERQRARQRVEVARADSGAYPVPTDLASRAARAVGLPTQPDKDAQAMREALARAKHEAAQAKAARAATAMERQTARAAAEKARADFAGAFDLPIPRFDQQPSGAASDATSRPAFVPKPGPDASRPRFARPR